jgi:hypothetical protein
VIFNFLTWTSRGAESSYGIQSFTDCSCCLEGIINAAKVWEGEVANIL